MSTHHRTKKCMTTQDEKYVGGRVDVEKSNII